jgi:hypothetical protein
MGEIITYLRSLRANKNMLLFAAGFNKLKQDLQQVQRNSY